MIATSKYLAIVLLVISMLAATVNKKSERYRYDKHRAESLQAPKCSSMMFSALGKTLITCDNGTSIMLNTPKDQPTVNPLEGR
jgi:hypothetical protein